MKKDTKNFNSDNNAGNSAKLHQDEEINVSESEMENPEMNEEESELDNVKNLLTQAQAEVEKEKKEYLFLMAEFDNFRKRTLRERTELVKTASEKVLKGLLPIVDDFERGLDAIKDSTDTESAKEGMQLIYNKLIKYLSENGVKAMETTGTPFDSDLHEAVAMIPATDDNDKGTIRDTVTKGYMLNDHVLRHAKVVVAQ